MKRPWVIAAMISVLAGGGVTVFASAGETAEKAKSSEITTAAESSRPEVEVWKSPTCGCCKEWVSYLERAGFPVTVNDTSNMNSVKARLGLPGPSVASCHTAMIDGYVVEGHVPVSDIERLLAERPDVIGISAPGMPMNSPGMGSDEPKGYDVVSFDAKGNEAVFSSH